MNTTKINMVGAFSEEGSVYTTMKEAIDYEPSTWRQTAREIYSSGAIMRGVWMWEKDDAIRIFWGDVIQNDSAIFCGRFLL